MIVLTSGLLWAQSQGNQNQADKNQSDQVPPAAQSGQPNSTPLKQEPVTGKTGNEATHINVTTSGSAGEETPGVQTNNGAQQQPGEHAEIKDRKAPKPNPRQKPGAPPNWEQVGQSPQSGNTGAAAASRAEIGGAGGRTLGVDAMPQSDQTSAEQQGSVSKKSKVRGKKSTKARQHQPAQQAQPPQ